MRKHLHRGESISKKFSFVKYEVLKSIGRIQVWRLKVFLFYLIFSYPLPLSHSPAVRPLPPLYNCPQLSFRDRSSIYLFSFYLEYLDSFWSVFLFLFAYFFLFFSLFLYILFFSLTFFFNIFISQFKYSYT